MLPRIPRQIVSGTHEIPQHNRAEDSLPARIVSAQRGVAPHRMLSCRVVCRSRVVEPEPAAAVAVVIAPSHQRFNLLGLGTEPIRINSSAKNYLSLLLRANEKVVQLCVNLHNFALLSSE